MVWRRSYDIPPPPVEKDSEFWPGNDVRYLTEDTDCPKDELPCTESLMLTR